MTSQTVLSRDDGTLDKFIRDYCERNGIKCDGDVFGAVFADHDLWTPDEAERTISRAVEAHGLAPTDGAATKFTVALYKPVSDVLRAFVEIEADTAEEAETKALALDMSNIEFVFWQCGDNAEPITAEVVTP